MAAAIGFFSAGSGRAQQVIFPLPFYEPFPSANAATPYNGFAYENNEELGQGVTEANGGLCTSNVWSYGNSISSSCLRVFTTNGQNGLQYPGLTNVDATYQTGLLSTYIKDTSSTKNRAAPLNIPANNTNSPMSLYASCLLSVETNTFSSATSVSPVLGLTSTGNGSSVNQNGAVFYINENLQLQLSKNSSTAAPNVTAALTPSNTYLIVLRYKYNPGGPGTNADSVDLWVSPTAIGNDSIVPLPTMTITNGANVASNYFGGIAVFESANPCFLYIDEIRVATNWAAVTPTNTPPGPTFSVTGGGAGCGNNSFNVGLSGSDAAEVYYLYTNGVPAGISSNGTGSAISFGLQTNSAVYTVVGSNTTTGFQGWMDGSVAVTVLASPIITTEPSPLTVPSGELGSFMVGISGSGQNYQWYKGGVALTNGGEFSGVQTSNLVIFPVTSADVANTNNGYYVVITNACGTSLASTTNSLALGAPGNLIWFGGQPTTAWDVGITANWDTNASNFNYGDNVTFDDNSASENVTLANNFLSPSTMTINGAGAYVFTGPGGLAGSGSIVMNSTGTASFGLGLNNSETGGITISNGIFTFSQAGNLGSGIINLAGGELATANVGQIFINNVIDVVSSNSAIGVNSTGGQNLFVTNIINGISGNLTLFNNSTKVATPSIVFEYPTFTFNLPVDINVGGIGGGLYLEDANTSGVHTWANVISDSGSVWRNGSGGQTVLGATNIYSGGTLLTLGPLGVATNSVVVSGSLMSGPLGTGTLTIDTRSGSPEIFAYGGPRSVANPITWYSNVSGPAFVISGSNLLTFAGGVDFNQTNRTINISNTASAVFSGIITDDGLVLGLSETGTGYLYLDGANSYTGGTTNTGNLLAGTGSVQGPVIVQAGASLGAGDPSGIGTFTINGSVTLGGNVLARVNSSLTQSNDSIVATDGITNTGTGVVTVSNIGPALAVGQRFALFNDPVVNGAAMTVTGANVQWTNNLARDGSISVLSLSAPPPPARPIVNAAYASGGSVIFSGTNGTPGQTYYVLTTTNLALPISQWSVALTNTFAPGGAYSVTNALNRAVPGTYFIVEIP